MIKVTNSGAKFICKIFDEVELNQIKKYSTEVAAKKKLIHQSGELAKLKWYSCDFDLEFAKNKIDDFLNLKDSKSGMRVLYYLSSGVRLPLHRDYSGASASNRIRFHVPIITHEDVKFTVNGDIITMAEGELWMLDTSYLHSVSNDSPFERVHIIYEVDINDTIKNYIPKNLAHRIHLLNFWIISFCKLTANLIFFIFVNPSKAFNRLRVALNFILWKFGFGHIQPKERDKS